MVIVDVVVVMFIGAIAVVVAVGVIRSVTVHKSKCSELFAVAAISSSFIGFASTAAIADANVVPVFDVATDAWALFCLM